MRKYVVWDEICEIEMRGLDTNFTAQQIIDSYLSLSENDAEIVSIFDSEEEAIEFLDKMELCSAKGIDLFSGLVHIAFVCPADFDEPEPENLCAATCGDVIKIRVGS